MKNACLFICITAFSLATFLLFINDYFLAIINYTTSIFSFNTYLNFKNKL